MNHEPITIEQTYNASVKQVWNALTNKDEMKQWYFDIPDFKPTIGLDFHFLAGPEGKEYMHLCKVIEAVPERRIAYSWRYDGYPGNSLVTFELTPENHSTKLKLTHVGVETFQTDDPNFAKESFEAGWTEILGKNLPSYLEKNSGGEILS